MSALKLSLIMTVIILAAVHLGNLGLFIIMALALYSAYQCANISMLHFLMWKFPDVPPNIAPSIRLQVNSMIHAYPSLRYAAIDATCDMIQVGTLFYFAFPWAASVILLAHILAWAAYYMAPGFNRRLGNDYRQ